MPECDTRPNASSALLAGRNVDSVIKGAALGRIGNLEVRLARNEAEIAAAQEVRYRVFYDELGARKDLFRPMTAVTPTGSIHSATICWFWTPRFPVPNIAVSSAHIGFCGKKSRPRPAVSIPKVNSS